jgi:hypothetical protein
VPEQCCLRLVMRTQSTTRLERRPGGQRAVNYIGLVDRIRFVVGTVELGVGPDVRADPVINGRRLVALLNEAAGGDVVLAGLPPHHLRQLAHLEATEPRRMQVLGCGCGDTQCSSANVEVVASDDQVVWRNFQAGRYPDETWGAIGPFQFDRAEYDAAIAQL